MQHNIQGQIHNTWFILFEPQLYFQLQMFSSMKYIDKLISIIIPTFYRYLSSLETPQIWFVTMLLYVFTRYQLGNILRFCLLFKLFSNGTDALNIQFSRIFIYNLYLSNIYFDRIKTYIYFLINHCKTQRYCFQQIGSFL